MAKLVGFDHFVRSNPKSDRFAVRSVHHIEFVCADAQTTAARWAGALGMHHVESSCLSTGNPRFASHVIASGAIRFVFTAPTCASDDLDDKHPTVNISPMGMHAYFRAHGLSAIAVGLHVENARVAFESAVANGAVAVTPPRSSATNDFLVSEVRMHEDGDAVLRFVSGLAVERGACLPGYKPTATRPGAEMKQSFGFARIDHVVSNVHKLLPAIDYVQRLSGFHEFAEFTSEDVGTCLSGLNSMVLANNDEMVLLPFNEPTSGGARKSQIQTYLEQHAGPGVQHIALKTNDIFATVRAMRSAYALGCGFELMERPRPEYFRALRGRLGPDVFSQEQADLCETLGILADRDDQGILLQIFTRPVGDRATLFLEVIQRVGCDEGGKVEQKGGCGGFGKGNFHELFRAIEDFETQSGINALGPVGTV